MFESLTEKLVQTLRVVSGKNRLNEELLDEACRQLRTTLLEADVNVKVVKDFVAQVRTRSLQAFDHQDMPYGSLVDRINTARSFPPGPLTQVMLAWQNNKPAELVLGDLDITAIPVHTETARMNFLLSLAERFTDSGAAAGISGVAEYRTSVFTPAAVDSIIQRLQKLLTVVTADPRRPLPSILELDQPL